MKVRLIIPISLQKKAFDQPHVSHKGIEQTRLLSHESIHWININADRQNTINISLYTFIFNNVVLLCGYM